MSASWASRSDGFHGTSENQSRISRQSWPSAKYPTGLFWFAVKVRSGRASSWERGHLARNGPKARDYPCGQACPRMGEAGDARAPRNRRLATRDPFMLRGGPAPDHERLSGLIGPTGRVRAWSSNRRSPVAASRATAFEPLRKDFRTRKAVAIVGSRAENATPQPEGRARSASFGDRNPRPFPNPDDPRRSIRREQNVRAGCTSIR